MASLVHDGWLQWRVMIGSGSGRKTIRFRGDLLSARRFHERIERLTYEPTAPPEDLAEWINSLPEKMHRKLVRAGLAPLRQLPHTTALGPFIDEYLASRTTDKPATLENFLQVRKWLVQHFGEHMDIRTIDSGMAKLFRLSMVKGGLGENTIRRHVGRCRQLFKSAIRRGMMRSANPFEGMSTTVHADKKRQQFITRDEMQKVLDACPDVEWKLIFALSRYGGLRCPSETLGLKWSDVNWEKNRFRITSPKMEYLGYCGCSREVPIFPELRPLLLEARAQSQPDAEYVVHRYDKRCNLGTQAQRIIRRAGLVPWPKTFHNLRATCQTELSNTYPLHFVCKWLGNTKAVALEHYLQLTDADFDRAAG